MKRCLEFYWKVRYNTKKDAETSILYSGINLKSYYCETCKGWHLTSK